MIIVIILLQFGLNFIAPNGDNEMILRTRQFEEIVNN